MTKIRLRLVLCLSVALVSLSCRDANKDKENDQKIDAEISKIEKEVELLKADIDEKAKDVEEALNELDNI